MYFLELEDRTYINLFGLRKWGGSDDFIVLHYPGKEQVVLNGEDARRARLALSGFVAHVPFESDDE